MNSHKLPTHHAEPESQASKLESNTAIDDQVVIERRESDRSNSSFSSLVKSSPLDVKQCTQEQFLTHIFGSNVPFVLAPDDLNAFYVQWLPNPRSRREFFNPVTLSRDHETRPYGKQNTQSDVLKKGNLKYAAFVVCTEELPGMFTNEVECGAYPTAAIISVTPFSVHMLCKVDAKSLDQYRDRCELILRVANDNECSRGAYQISFCAMPSIEKANLLYLNPGVLWDLPVPTKDFA
jgi:hypothetical protein